MICNAVELYNELRSIGSWDPFANGQGSKKIHTEEIGEGRVKKKILFIPLGEKRLERDGGR